MALRTAAAILVATLGATAPAAEKELHGRIHYAERGSISGPIGITSAIFGSFAGGIGVAKLQGIGKVLSAFGGGGAADTKRISDKLDAGMPAGLDASQLPLIGGYDADLDFVLAPSPSDRDTWVLKSGTVRFSADNQSRFHGSDGEGRAHDLEDHVVASGSAKLDPARDRIELRWVKAGDHDFELTVDVKHRMKPSGRSHWNATYKGNSIFRMELEYVGTEQRISMEMLGKPAGPPTTSPGDVDRGIAFTKAGKRAELTGAETWRNLVDAQVLVEYRLAAGCTATLLPARTDWVFQEKDGGFELEGKATAEVVPQAFGDDLEWQLPRIAGAELTTWPENARGREITFRYRGLPKRSSDFGKKKLAARFGAHKGECPDPEEREVRVFFPRDAMSPEEPTHPNWFEFWKQTRAGQGHEANVYFEGSYCESMAPGSVQEAGYYSPDGFGVHVCDLKRIGFAWQNLITQTPYQGIDVLGALVTHEWTHKEYRERLTSSHAPDGDRDGISDAEEGATPMPLGLPGTLGPGDRLSILKALEGRAGGRADPADRAYLTDQEILTFIATDDWKVGSADAEDWACPGKQCDGE
jgi:hypothetical protein